MTLAQIKAYVLPVVAGMLALALFGLVQPAFASERDDLKLNYQTAVINYESAIVAQDRNAAEIVKAEDEIARTERKIARAQEELSETAVKLYKSERGSQLLIDLLLDSESFQDAVMRYDQYSKIAEYYCEKAQELEEAKTQLAMRRGLLEKRKLEIIQEVEAAKQAEEAAALALLDNTHSDGARFHQVQGVGNNCGATSFIVAVNIILHENRYPDNVAVWQGPGFNGDSTTDMAWKGSNWLLANGLFDFISIETISGDIHTTDQMREWLEAGYVIVASSGSGSVWQRADGTQATNAFPDGHWQVFYCYEDGVFYANDSSVQAAQGAGCPYDEYQMQQWLDGRSNHFATALKKR